MPSKSRSLIIQNTMIVLPEQAPQNGMVKVVDGQIIDIKLGQSIDPEATTGMIINANGHYLFPGAIAPSIPIPEAGLLDSQTFFEISQACIQGGITTFISEISSSLETEDSPGWLQQLPSSSQSSIANYGFSFQDSTTATPPISWEHSRDQAREFFTRDQQSPKTLESQLTSLKRLTAIPEIAFPLILTHAQEAGWSLSEVSSLIATAAAQGLGLDNKGAIALGYDADLVLVDLKNFYPVIDEGLQTKYGWSPNDDWALTGWPLVTFVGGEIAFDHGDFYTSVQGQPLNFQ